MPRHAKGSLQLSVEDRQKLKTLLQGRINCQIMRATRFRTSTQKSEAVNSAYRTTNPKHSSTFSRNAAYRDHSAIHLTNNGPGESIALKMSAVGLRPGRLPTKTLKELQSVRNYSRQRSRCMRYKNRRAQLRTMKYKLHDECKNDASSSGYEKNQLVAEIANDHTYPTV